MALRKEEQAQDWLDDGIRHLKLLCQQAIKCADEGDIFPTDKEITSAVKLMSAFRDTHVPTMALTVNGEVTFTWEGTGDSFQAYVKQDGTIRFYRNKGAIDQRTFTKYLNAVPA